MQDQCDQTAKEDGHGRKSDHNDGRGLAWACGRNFSVDENTDAQVAAASLANGTFHSKQDKDLEYYLMQHSTFTCLSLPGTGFVDASWTVDGLHRGSICIATTTKDR
jgi:hypothetical protein